MEGNSVTDNRPATKPDGSGDGESAKGWKELAEHGAFEMFSFLLMGTAFVAVKHWPSVFLSGILAIRFAVERGVWCARKRS